MKLKKAGALILSLAVMAVCSFPGARAAQSDWKIGSAGNEMSYKSVAGGDQFTAVKGMKYTNDTRFVSAKKQNTQGTAHILRLDDIQHLIDTADGWLTMAWLQNQGRLQINSEPSFLDEEAIGFGLEFRFMGLGGKTVKVCLTKYTRDEGGGNDSIQKEIEIPAEKILKIEVKSDTVYINDKRVNFGKVIKSTVALAGAQSYFSVNLHENTGSKSAVLTMLDKMPEGPAATTTATGSADAPGTPTVTTAGGGPAAATTGTRPGPTVAQEPGDLTLEDIKPGDYYKMGDAAYNIISVNGGVIEVETKAGKRDFYELDDFILGEAAKISREEFDGPTSTAATSGTGGDEDEYGEWEVVSETRLGNQWPWWGIVLTTIGGVGIVEGAAFAVYRVLKKKSSS